MLRIRDKTAFRIVSRGVRWRIWTRRCWSAASSWSKMSSFATTTSIVGRWMRTLLINKGNYSILCDSIESIVCIEVDKVDCCFVNPKIHFPFAVQSKRQRRRRSDFNHLNKLPIQNDKWIPFVHWERRVFFVRHKFIPNGFLFIHKCAKRSQSPK